MSYQILLVDEHRIVRDGIKAIIERSGEFEVVAEAEDGSDAVRISRGINPDVVVIVVGVPSAPAIETTCRILQHAAKTRVILLSMAHDEEPLISALRAGARGLVLNRASAGDLLDALRTVAQGGSYISPGMSDHLIRRLQQDDTPASPTLVSRSLTPRELEVLRLVTTGATSKEIASKLELSVETVRSYRKSMMRKLHVNNVAGLIQVAIQEGLTHWTQHSGGKYT
ncbi:MAG: two component transcriptional regulator, LuxR family [Bryobacterales bacterium]|nr:two component transcriptional regulator, LuxR family [Bryobacterales bacterium]